MKLPFRIKFDAPAAGYVGYTAFFLMCLVFFAALSFPYDRLRDFAVQQVAESAPASDAAPPRRLAIGEIGPTWSLGVALTDVAFEQDAAQPGSMPVALKIDSPGRNITTISGEFPS